MTDPTPMLPASAQQTRMDAGHLPAPLALVGRPLARELAPTSQLNLSAVSEQLAELQQKLAKQVGVVESSLHRQQEDMDLAVSQIPDLKGKVNWLIASLYEQTSNNSATKERIEEVAADVAELRHALGR